MSPPPGPTHGLPDHPPPRVRVVEWFAGIGGFASSVTNADCLAIDINQLARDVYLHNHLADPSRYLCREIESIEAETIESWQADFWWMSPPCQPFTRKGNQRDLSDPRTAGFLALLALLEKIPPPRLVLENVPGFATSQVLAKLLNVLRRKDYCWTSVILCPSSLGIPNRRRRFYLLATRGEHATPGPADLPSCSVAQPGFVAQPSGTAAAPTLLDLEAFLRNDNSLTDSADSADSAGSEDYGSSAADRDDLVLSHGLWAKYRSAIDVVLAGGTRPTAWHSDRQPTNQITACFTAAYGKSVVRSGSYLFLPGGGLRRFAPAEILRLLGFPASFCMPQKLTLRQQWKLVGNSLSLYGVRHLLASFNGLFELSQPAVPLPQALRNSPAEQPG